LLDGDGILGIAYDAVIENAIGGSNTDTILGNESDNKLYGGTGSGVKDTLTGGAGADTFICSISDATTDINLADIITDFTAGTDKIGLEDKTVAELSWSDTSGGTQIYETSTSKILFYLNSVSASAIDEDDFVQTDFA
jgi:Ca2+-binding RTX toxin-like protein